MKIHSRCLPAALFLMVICGMARAEDETIADERLKQKVTYAASETQLQKVAEDLTKKTGVLIRVGSGDRDWKDKERQVHVQFKDLPLGAVLQGISQTLGYELRRAGSDGNWSYRIYQSARNRDYEAAMLASQQQEKEQEIAGIREKVLSDAEEALKMTPEEAEKLKETDPWKAYLGGTPSGRAYAQLMSGLPGEARELMLRGRKVTLNASDLSPAMSNAMQQMVDGSFFKRMGDEQGARALGDALKRATPGQVTFMPLDQEMVMGPMSASSMGMTGVAMVMGEIQNPTAEMTGMMDQMSAMGMGRGMPMAAMPIAGGDSMAARMFGKMMNRLDSGEKFQDVQQDMVTQMQGGGIYADLPGSQVTPTATPTDPALLVEVDPIKITTDLLGQTSQSAALVKEMGKVTNVSYVVESHPETMPLAMFLPQKKEPLYKVLDTVQRAGLTWEYANGVVRIKPKDWAVQRSYDVPESLLTGYRKILEAKGWFDFDTLASLFASTTEGQFQHRIMKDKELSTATMTMISFGGGAHDLLRFYGELTPAQKAQIKSTEGLPFDQLTESQWQRLATTVDDETQGAEVRPGRVTLAMKEDAFPQAPRPATAPEKPPVSTPPAAAQPGSDAKPDAASPQKPGEPKPEAGSSPATSKPASPAENSKQPGANAAPPLPTGPMLVQATFTVEMASDKPNAPYKIVRMINVPTPMQIAGLRQGLEQMRKQAAAQQKKSGDAKTEEVQPGKAPSSSKPETPSVKSSATPPKK